MSSICEIFIADKRLSISIKLFTNSIFSSSTTMLDGLTAITKTWSMVFTKFFENAVHCWFSWCLVSPCLLQQTMNFICANFVALHRQNEKTIMLFGHPWFWHNGKKTNVLLVAKGRSCWIRSICRYSSVCGLSIPLKKTIWLHNNRISSLYDSHFY